MATRLSGNRSLQLDDPATVWIVERGSVGVFFVAPRDGKPAGPRRFLFRCEPGDALFGMPPGASAGAVVAVALEDAELTRRPRQELERSGAAGAGLVARWLEAWKGCSGWSADLPAAGPSSLDALHENLLRRLGERIRSEDEAERARLVERQRLSQRASLAAVAELTAVLGRGAVPVAEGSELLVAATAVGTAQGIRVLPPAEWETATSLADPVELIARASHVRTRRVRLPDRWWTRDAGPLLGFLGPERRPVALLPRPAAGYEVLDPRSGSRIPADEASTQELDSEACAFYRTLPAQAVHAGDLIRFALRGRARDLLLTVATATAATLHEMVTPQATALLIDQAIPDAKLDLLLQLGLALLAAALGAAAFRLAQGIALLRLETAADAATQAAVWDRLLNLQLAFFRRFSTGDLQSRVTAISQIRAYLSGTTLRSLFSGVILLLNLALLLYYSPPLALLALGIAATSAATTVVSGALILRYARRALELRGVFFGLMVQLIHGVAKLRVAAAEERAFARWAADYAELTRLGLGQRRVQDAVALVNVLISAAGTVLLFALAAGIVGRGGAGLTTGVFLAFNAAYGTFIGAVVQLSNTVTDVLAIAILRERARPILESVPEISERKTDPGRLAGRVELEQVVFRYDLERPLVLDGVDLRAEPGEFVALVGPSGSGKSTVLRLLLGLETPHSGAIYFDGQDLSGLDVFAVRRQLGVVLQGGRINAGSIFDNIACSARISLNDAWEAARAVGFADDVAAMPMGLHTVVNEGGGNLSGGQRQRLLLSRALVQRPRILLLDEATSALDNRTQAVVSESLERFDVTRIVVAHRLSTIRRADRIYVIDGGRVAQQGRFDELAGSDGLFARLMLRQLA